MRLNPVPMGFTIVESGCIRCQAQMILVEGYCPDCLDEARLDVIADRVEKVMVKLKGRCLNCFRKVPKGHDRCSPCDNYYTRYRGERPRSMIRLDRK